MDKYLGKGVGYALGVFVVIPAIIIIVNFIFLRGNKVTQKEITQYIDDSKTVELFIPPTCIPKIEPKCKIGEGIKDRTILKYKNYSLNSTQENNIKTFNRFIFYSQKYNKYMMLINFNGFDYRGAFNLDLNDDRISVIWSGKYFMVRINNIQLNDESYGSEKNPIPVFGITLSGHGYETIDPQVLAEDRKHSDVSEQVNRIFVEQYLNNFISNESFKKLFRK
ncbi:hypothetical protein [Salmonella enterica]|uniref:hypothetical protein n=1 Tax=Salmonella enterica TaxID=28901 RepID=UPI0009B195F1|nr:hypothetical protein [Salmonella enterica]EEJ9033710.1 hypothetical protein [Salmonella enterica subsp. enterica serovar Oslo]MBA3216371.1 hypothetical protein [Salmonella enterica]